MFSRTPCRCKKCKRRKTLKRHPDNYVIVPKCSCGNNTWNIDNYRIKVEYKNSRINKCYCFVYKFPHRKSSGYCVHGKLFDQSDEDQYKQLFYRHEL